MNTITKLNGVEASTYETLAAAIDNQFDMVVWELLPGDDDEKAETYWAAMDDDLINEHSELDLRYQCDGCDRYFLPADLSVADGTGDYCWDDHTGNGCRSQHLPDDEK